MNAAVSREMFRRANLSWYSKLPFAPGQHFLTKASRSVNYLVGER
jgi:hypothetical protein